MSQEKYNLNWHTSSDHLREMLQEMMQSNQLTDVTLVCDDKRQLKAHKIVLSACSSVFKCIVNDIPQNNSIIYLRGIQHQEMESILEFMYLGVATFYQERMNDFLNVAKNLEIKEISKDVELDDENASALEEPEIDTELVSEPQQTNNVSDINEIPVRNMESKLQRNMENKFECNQCDSTFTRKDSLITHNLSVHEGVKYACNHCEHLFSDKANLTTHIKSIHEGIKYPCNQCDYQATQQSRLKTHIQSKYEGVKYSCNHCEHQFSHKDHLTKHIKSIHEGIKYPCNQCDYQAAWKSSLKTHIQAKHKGVRV